MTTFYGELFSILTAMTWTVTALCADVASHRMGQLQMNVLRMGASLVILAVILWVFTGSPLPQAMNGEALAWLLASGAVGYVFGDYCLFTSYVLMGSRMGQLFMTLAPLFSALTAWLLLGETLSLQAIAGIVVTITGIGVVIRGKDPSKSPRQGRLSFPVDDTAPASPLPDGWLRGKDLMSLPKFLKYQATKGRAAFSVLDECETVYPGRSSRR